MKKLIFLLIGLFTATYLLAGVVTEEEALQKAERFLQGKKVLTRAKASRARGKQSDAGADFGKAFYVFNVENKGGFVIVSGDDRTEEILGYSESGEMDLDNLPSNVKAWLEGYQRQIEALGDRTITRSVTRSPSPEWAIIEPLIKTKWNQGKPYNLQCPEIDGIHFFTGCVATAIAQIMNYYRCPADGKLCALKEYYGYYVDEDGSYITYTVPALEETQIDWNLLQNRYNDVADYTEAQAQEVAKLMRYVAQSEYTNFTTTGSASSNSKGNWLHNFGYNKPGAAYINRYDYTTSEWESIIYNELSSGRPVLYCGTGKSGGHSFICDGYAGDRRFYFNWGWGGSCDGQYLLTVLDPNYYGIGEPDLGDQNSFHIGQAAYINVKPKVGNEGAIFKVPTSEGYDITYAISSDRDGVYTCSVGDGRNQAVARDCFGELTIPSEVSYAGVKYKVVKVQEGAFRNSYFKSISLPETIEFIDLDAFYDCYNLKNLTIPKSVTKICGGMISACKELKSLTVEIGNPNYISENNVIIEGNKTIASVNTTMIPENVFEVGARSFYYMGPQSNENNIEITIPEYIKRIDHLAFDSCNNCVFTVEHEVPIVIEKYAFNRLKNCILKVPYGTKAAYQAVEGWSVFGDNIIECDPGEDFTAKVGYSQIDMAFTVTGNGKVKVGYREPLAWKPAVDETLFEWNTQTHSIQESHIEIPETVEHEGKTYKVVGIKDYAFVNVEFATISLPSTLRSIGKSVFSNRNMNFQMLVIPGSVTDISPGAIDGCPSLTSIMVEPGNPIYSSEGNAIIELGNKLVVGTSATVISENITEIGPLAFSSMSGATITIPKSVITIGDEAFADSRDCIIISENEHALPIPYSVFSGCENCVLKVPAGSKDEYEHSNWSCGIDYIFEANSNEGTEFTTDVGGLDMTFTIINDGKEKTVMVGHFMGRYDNTAIDIETDVATVNIPQKVTYNNEFYSVTSIGKYAFYMISDKKVIISESIVSIGDWAFGSCTNTTFVVNSLEPASAQYASFFDNVNSCLRVPAGCKQSYLEAEGWKLFSPENVYETSVGIEFVTNVDGLDMAFTITCDDTEKTVKAGHRTGSIDNPAIERNSTVTEVNIPQSVTYKGTAYDVTAIGDYAFSSFENLIAVTIPESIGRIGSGAFWGNENLERVVSKNPVPFPVTDNVFSYEGNNHEQNSSQATLYVPVGSSPQYSNSSAWKKFTDIQEGECLEGTDGTLWYFYSTGSKKATVVRHESYSNLAKNLEIPATVSIDGTTCQVTAIGRKTFKGNYNLTTITLSDGISCIGDYAFAYMYGATVTLPATLKSIGKSVFEESGKSVIISPFRELTSITVHTEAFNGCFSAELRVPFNTKDIYLAAQGWNQFSADDIIEGYKGIEFKENVDGIDVAFMITADDNNGKTAQVVYSAGYEERAIAPNLKNVELNIPETVVFLGSTYRITGIGHSAFYKTGLSRISLPSSIESIEGWAFAYLNNLTLNIPSSVRSIGYYAFSNCQQSVFTAESPTPLTIDETVFMDTGDYNSILRVPSGSKSAYLEAKGWNQFLEDHVIEYNNIIRGDVNGDGEVDIADAVCIVNHIVGKATPVFVEAAADVNNDGDIDIADAVRVVNLIVGKINTLARQKFSSLPEPE